MKITLKLLLTYNLSFTLCWLSGSEANAQNIGMNGTGANAHPSALVDIDATSGPATGLLIPRIPLQAINLAAPVTSPATSLLVYNTASANTGTNAVSAGYYYWDGVKWVRFAYNASGSSSTAWDLLGNAGTVAGTNFIGTTDNQDLVFKTNNTEKIRIMSAGNTGIGTNNPLTKLDVRGVVSADVGSLLSPAYTFVGDVKTGFFQPANGELAIVTSATSYGNDNYRARFSAYEIRVGNNINTLDLGTESKFIIQGSENGPSSNFPFASLGFSNNSNQLGQTSAEIAKILCSSQDATANQGRLELQTKDGTTLATRVMIDKNGNVGINTSSPTEKLEVQGSVKIVDGTQGLNKVLTSDATGKASWQIPIISNVVVGIIPATVFTATAIAGNNDFYSGVSYSLTAGVWEIEYQNWGEIYTFPNSGFFYTQLSTSNSVIIPPSSFSLNKTCLTMPYFQGATIPTETTRIINGKWMITVPVGGQVISVWNGVNVGSTTSVTYMNMLTGAIGPYSFSWAKKII